MQMEKSPSTNIIIPDSEPLVHPATVEETKAIAQLKRKWGIRSHSDLQERVRELGQNVHLIEGRVPTQSVDILVGDSGLGKSPLLYQAGICLAADIPWLGCEVRKAPVLYLDFENGLADSMELQERLACFLGLDKVPEDFYVWNLNDCSPEYGQRGHTAAEMIREWASAVGSDYKLAVIDSLGTFCPDIEEKNKIATENYQKFRAVNRDCRTSIIGSHHIRKPSSKPEDAPPSLDRGNLRNWFHQARGARALINGADIRLGVDIPSIQAGHQDGNEEREEIALVLRGFGRIRGEFGPTYLLRIRDEDGVPLGYRRMVGVELLFNPHQREAYKALPETFAFAEAKRTYGRQDQATTDFLQKCQGVGLLRKVGRGTYAKQS
jgi:hypothetical protein